MIHKLTPTKQTAIKLLDIISHGLVKGVGNPKPGELCVEAALCLALDLPHGDGPPCVSRAVRSFKIALNDSDWSSNDARGKGLRRLAIAQLGSDSIDDSLFVKELSLATIRKIVPIALRAAAKVHPDKKHKEALNNHASECERAADAADAAYAAYAARAADAAAYAARAACAADAADAAHAAKDEVLNLMAEIGVEVLQLCKSPGCQWLDLAPI